MLGDKKRLKKRLVLLAAAGMILLIGGVSVCRYLWEDRNPLDPEDPILLTLWQYRSGSAKAAFDDAVQNFNDTVGEEMGIVVETYSIGNIDHLADAIYTSANGSMGANPMPDIFTAYNEHAFQVDRYYGLVSLEEYFSEEELSAFNQEFLDSGRIGEKKELKNLPAARSTECIYLNRTDWDKFAGEMDVDISELSSWEGIARTAQLYYEWSGGKPFYGEQNLINTIKVTAALERIKAGVDDGVQDAELYYSRESARKIWDYYYKPCILGYYSMEVEEQQSMNAMKQGNLLMVIASTAGAVYCPDEVWVSAEEHYPIQCEVLPYPVYEGEEKYAALRGNSFCIVKSDYRHEYASAVFLKWFTETEQNIAYAMPTGYLPVKQEALTPEVLSRENQEDNKVVGEAQKIALEMLYGYELYEDHVTLKSSDFDRVFEGSIKELASGDRERVNKLLETEGNAETLIQEYLSEEHFEEWYEGYLKKAKQLELARLMGRDLAMGDNNSE